MRRTLCPAACPSRVPVRPDLRSGQSRGLAGPEARQQGIGTALTLEPLREARETGYRIGILHPSEMGVGVYGRLGFEECCKLSCATWTGEGANSQ